jgi:hypothetical protein
MLRTCVLEVCFISVPSLVPGVTCNTGIAGAATASVWVGALVLLIAPLSLVWATAVRQVVAKSKLVIVFMAVLN